ncbi:hypothetical protein VE01_04959 [Pseudogymnoascus verrucosus]|uniref:Uncharacterized protein n=1 Tax=Pseudogymnoascus verrucosus TaxID=342668 RepID=A0A1B8GPD3_9PEZI|nr:uncharacterized protein VE01_04959 [Pseudogymnoascus verrucosus]OBT97705.1 hypothetical protein VE01_04959 [Pseudogymnoascus verrucosus]
MPLLQEILLAGLLTMSSALALTDGQWAGESKSRIPRVATGSTRLKKFHYASLVALIEREGVIGEVIHASGLRHSSAGEKRHRMDWALVALHPSKDAVLNTPPDDSKFNYTISRVPEFAYHYRTEPGDVISRTSDPVAFSWAGKVHAGAWGLLGG